MVGRTGSGGGGREGEKKDPPRWAESVENATRGAPDPQFSYPDTRSLNSTQLYLIT